jgi:hypothetical protein
MEPWMWVAVGLGAWSIYFGALGWYVATVKERDPLEGILLAILAGPLGVLLEALFPQGNWSLQASAAIPSAKESTASAQQTAGCAAQS